MLNLTFLEARIGRLSKAVSATGITPYPNAAKFRSSQYPVTDAETFAARLREQAARGHCLHVGDLVSPLPEWGRRAGLANRQSELRWFVLDIDGVSTTTANPPLNAELFAEIARCVVDELHIPELDDVTFVAQASTKLGLSNASTSMHLFFLLDGPVFSHQLKTWLKTINLRSNFVRSNIRLSANGHSLCWPLDISCADPGRLIYIAPPIFTDGLVDPFANPDDRVVVVHRNRPEVEHRPIRTAEINQREEAKLKQQLRDLAGFNPLERPRLRTLTVNGEAVELLLNPAQGRLRYNHTARGFCYYNLNDGDSCAYYHAEGRPDIIYNFKGEPAFRWADVDRTGYDDYCAANAELIAKADPINTFVVVNQRDDRIYKIWHHHENNTVTLVASSREAVADFYAEYGKVEPEFLPTWTIEYNPSINYLIDYNGKSINTFLPSECMKRGIITVPAEAPSLDNPKPIADACPHIWFLLDHLAGHGRNELAYFMNWLAVILQRREKTGTAMIFQGGEGTGKGSLYREILLPIFGEQNASQRNNDALTDTFDAWRASKLIVCFDEFEVNNNATGRKQLARLRQWITEAKSSVRAMRQMGEDLPLFDNYIFNTNQHGIMPVTETDRRYTICPRQEHNLAARCDTNELFSGLRSEVTAFGSLLHAFVINRDAARYCLHNEAKQTVRRAAATTAEEFAAALRDGNLDFMMAVFDTLQNATNPDQIINLDTARRTVTDMVRGRGDQAWYSVADLTTLYNTLADQRLSPIAFGKMMGRRGLTTDRYYHGEERRRGYQLKFDRTELTDAEIASFLASRGQHLHAVGASA